MKLKSLIFAVCLSAIALATADGLKAQNCMQIGSYLSRAKLTARLYFQQNGGLNIDLGNVELAKQPWKIDAAKRTQNAGGMVRVIHEEPSETDLRWSFKLSEFLGSQLALLHLANSYVVQNAGTRYV